MTAPDPPLIDLLADLAAETEVLEETLTSLTPDQWAEPTPAEGWTVHDQVTHLMYFDETATLAVIDPEGFRAHAASMQRRGPDFVDQVAADLRALSPDAVLRRFVSARNELIAAYSREDRRRRVPWYGPEMSVMSAATARLMETWAHGVDIADTVGVPIVPSRRLRHVAHLGFVTRRFSFTNHGLKAPVDEAFVELDSSGGEVWSFGPPDATDRVTGSALAFCLVVTQRRTLDQTTGLHLTGPSSYEWLSVAQAFAGPPTTATAR